MTETNDLLYFVDNWLEIILILAAGFILLFVLFILGRNCAINTSKEIENESE
jgi:hypothetical protein